MNTIELELFPINENELLQIWEQYTDTMIKDKHEKTDSKTLNFMRDTIRDLASGEVTELHDASEGMKDLLGEFIKSFVYDEDTYEFQHMFQYSKGHIDLANF